MNDLISRSALKEDLLKRGFFPVIVKCALEAAPVVDAVVIPCKIGDEVWCVRGCGNFSSVKSGIVGEIFFSHKMELFISVKHVLKGRWGIDIFGSKAEAEAAARKRATEKRQDTLCWQCKKSGGLCSWSSNLTPVDGWEAKETLIKFPEKVVSGFCVLRCPQFEEG